MKKSLAQTVDAHRPLQVLGVINAYCAIMAEQAGAKALYLSGAGVANASYGLPDLGLTTLENVCEDVRRITTATSLPVLVDADTGWEDPAASVAALECAGAAGCHLEDQVPAKRCGHRPGKELVSPEEMRERLESALGGRSSPDFTIMARTDAAAVEGLDAAIDRAQRYAEAGAAMIFAEALTDLEQFRTFTATVPVPVLANMTEFGKTPYHSAPEFGAAGVRLVLYPLTAFRAMNQAALSAFREILERGTQEGILDSLQTRDELYRFLDYHAAETRQRTPTPEPPS